MKLSLYDWDSFTYICNTDKTRAITKCVHTPPPTAPCHKTD